MWSCFFTSAICSSRFFLKFFLWSYSSLIWGVDRFDPLFIALLTDKSRILMQELIVSSTNFELKVDRSVSRSKLLPLLLSLLLQKYFWRVQFYKSFSKGFIISALLLTKSFPCLLNFSSSFNKVLIYGINSSYSLDFRASMKSLFDCVPVKSFTMLLFDLLEISKSFKIAGSVE